MQCIFEPIKPADVFRGPKVVFLSLFITAFSFSTRAQQASVDSVPKAIRASQAGFDKKKLWIVSGSHAAIWGGCFLALNQAWYADYPRAKFHLFNDNNEWLQMDKAGHIWTAYLITRLSSNMWRWTGIPEKRAVLFAGIGAIAFQSIIEIQDGFSQEWGFSLGDMAANAAGAATYVAQQIVWKEQRLLVKFSSYPHDYPQDLLTRRNQLLGKSFGERVLKDYNGQTYWVSANIAAFFPETRLPGWLNIAIGYGGRGMLGGTKNVWKNSAGVVVDRRDIVRTRHFYLSPDIDLSRIKTSKKWLGSVLAVVNIIKIPAPALELNSKGKLRLSALQF